MKQDPDCVGLSNYLGTSYARARIIKALSFGIYCDTEFLMWCSGYEHPQKISEAIKDIANRLNLRISNTIGVGYIIRDQSDCDMLRKLMAAESSQEVAA